tara:strand:- start:1371 stop:2507 length:1137 start_codon:yes stop_codon:yes gene_type:complete
MKVNVTFVLSLVLGLNYALAGPVESSKEIIIEDPKLFCDRYDDLLGLATLYEGGHPILKELRLIGRYQGQYYNVESESDSSDWENRRFRFGFAAKFSEYLKFQTEFNLKRDFNQSGRLFEDVDDAYFTWEPSDKYTVKFGKLKPEFTREYSTSSKRIKTIERSLIVNEIVPSKAGGIVGTAHNWHGFDISFGGFSGQLTEDWGLPEHGSWGQYGRISRDFGENTNVRIDWFHRHGDREQNAYRPYHENFSLSSQSDWGRFHLMTDFIYADDAFNDLASDLNGAIIMPYFDLTDRLEAVLRYQFVMADEMDGIPVQKRYEREGSPVARGDEYHAIYGGLNWYICGDKLKIMNGVEWSTIDGFDRDHNFWTFMTAVRMYF